MEENKVDIELKRHFAQTTPAIPDVVRKRIQDTLSSLPAKKMIKPKYGYIAGAAVLVVGCVLGSSFVSPSMASVLSHLPLVGHVFERIGDSGLQTAVRKGATTQPNQSAIDRGLTLTLTDVLFDGNRFSIGYEMSSPEQNVSQLKDIQFSINGNDTNYRYTNIRKKINDHEVTGIFEIDPTLIKKDTASIEMIVTSIGGVEGKWIYHVSLNQQSNKIIAIKPMITKTVNDRSITIQSVEIAPSSIGIMISNNLAKKDIENQETLNYQVMDDRGRILTQIGAYAKEKGVELLFAPYDQSKYVTILPYKLKYFNSNEAPLLDTDHADVSSHLPIVLSQGDQGHITITQLDYFPDKTLMHLQIQGQDPMNQARNIEIRDKVGNIYLDHSPLLVPVDVHDGVYSFIEELPALPKDQKLTVQTKKLPALQFMKEFEIKVHLQ